MWHQEAKLGVGDAQYPQPCIHSSSHPLNQSLDRCPRCPSRHRVERRVTFWEPEVEPDPSERSCRGPQGCSFGIHLEDSNGVLQFAQRQETVCPPEMPIAYPDVGGRGVTWLSLLSGTLKYGWIGRPAGWNMPHWWVELTAIPDVENPKRLAWKIHTCFLIPVVRCETFPGQEYTVPPAPKCLTRNMFLPNNLSYQDFWQQPLLLTVAYAQVLQYWMEKFRLPVHPDYHPLAMSVMELMHVVKEHVIFYKWDILQGLGRIAPELKTGTWQSTTTDIRGMESNSAEAQEAHGANSLIVWTSTWGDPTSQTYCLAYCKWCWAYPTLPCGPSARGKHHSPFNWTQNEGLANWSRG